MPAEVPKINDPTHFQKTILHHIPKGYEAFVSVKDKWLFYNKHTHRYYDPTTHQYYNIATKGFEKAARPSLYGAEVLNPVVVQAPMHPTMEAKKVVQNGRAWQRFGNFSSATMKRLVIATSLLFTAALATATLCGGYATYALLISQGNPVGAILGFLTIYFGVATYKYAKIALERLRQK